MSTLADSLSNLFSNGGTTQAADPGAASNPGASGTPWEKAAHFTAWQDSPWGGGAEDSYARMASRALTGATAKGFELEGMEQEGIDEMKELVRGALPGIMESPMDRRDVGDQYAGMLEQIAQMKQSDMEAVTQYTGAAGLRGGVAADLVAQVELGSLGAVSRGMRDLRTVQANVEAQHKMTQLNAVMNGGQLLAAPPSTMGYESLASLAEWYGAAWGGERAARMQAEAQESQEKAAWISGGMSLAGSIAGGFLA